MPRSKQRESDVRLLGRLAEENDGITVAGASGVDLPRIERAVREILAAVGEDPDREGLLETPARVARMYAEMLPACTRTRASI